MVRSGFVTCRRVMRGAVRQSSVKGLSVMCSIAKLGLVLSCDAEQRRVEPSIVSYSVVLRGKVTWSKVRSGGVQLGKATLR